MTIAISSPFDMDYSGHFFFKILCKNDGENFTIDSVHEVFSYNPSRYFSINFSPNAANPDALDIQVTNIGPMPIIVKASFYSTTTITNDTDLGLGNRALDFDGVDDYVDVDLSPGTLNIPPGNSDHSVEFWIKYNGSQSGDICINWYGDPAVTDGAEIISFDGETGLLSVSRSGLPLTSCVNAAIDINDNWTHVAIAFNSTGNYNSIYINGSLIEVLNYGTTLNITPSRMQIGSWLNVSSQEKFMKATLDEYRFWEKELSPSEVADNMNQIINPSSSGLIIYYDFEQGVANGNNSGFANSLLDPNDDGIVNELLDKQSYASANDGVLYNFALTGSVSNWVSRG